ncbi:hypothetical protein C7Y69_21400 [Alteromonas sp. KS69]|nr:hypothetical protein C7Y69_21400 [Alteromonas sp. KS69]
MARLRHYRATFAPFSLALYAMKHSCFLLIILSLALVGCIAKPRGSYYQPFHPLGQAASRTCDANSNKVRLEITIEDGITMQTHLLETSNGSFVLEIGFVLEKNKEIKLHSDSIAIQFNEEKSLLVSLKEWKKRILVGGVVKQKYRGSVFEYNMSYSESISITESIGNTLKVTVPEFEVSGQRRQLAPIVFKKKSGEVQWLPKLNC